MPLIDFKTDLTNLPWGRDRRDGGSSNEPYIKDDIPQGISFDGLPNNSPDFLLRNGLRSIPTAAQDVSRLTQMFFDTKSPKGLQFVAKQNLLSKTSVKTEASKGPAYAGGALNQGAYSPLSTIAQAGVNFTGGHLNFLGLGEGFGGSLNKYEDVVKENNRGESNKNRLVDLSNTHFPNSLKQNNLPLGEIGGFLGIIGEAIPSLKKFIPEPTPTLLSYSGGPGSDLGIGNTVIRFADQRTGDKNTKYKQLKEKYNFSTYNSAQLKEKADLVTGDNQGLYPLDFRKELIPSGSTTSTVLSSSPNYRTQNVGARTFIGDPGKEGGQRRNEYTGEKNIFNYSIPANELQALDKINALPMYEGTGPDRSQAINDLCKFRIAAINNDTTNGTAVYMHFRAFLDNFDDNYNATWNAVNYVGRGDTLYNYGGFTRTVNLGFTAYAQSKAELIPMYKKLNYLASTLSPDYTQAGFMRGNLLRLTVGGYLYEQPGFITSLQYGVPQESTWEIAISNEGFIDGVGDKSVKELPHMIRCTMTYTPIHKFLPEKPDNANNPTGSQYIALDNGIYSNYQDEYRKYLK